MSVIEVTSFKQLFNTLKENSMREEIIQEQRLRRVIREKLKQMLSQENEQLLEEQRLRKIIRHKLLTEGDVSDMHPHRSTGINVLEDVLKKMITTLRTDYKRLTTSKAQRDSFRAHMLHAVKQSLMPALVNDMYLQDTDTLMAEPTGLSTGDEEAKSPSDEMLADIDDLNLDDIELEEDIDIDVDPDPEKDLDIEGEKEKTPAEQEKDEFGSGLEEMDETGKNMAYTTHKKVSQYILDAYDMLTDRQDKKVFVDYLITNMKLYFDKFEGELASELQEPTTPEYEQAKASI
tara:strand:+ start:372 stop:1241 length:870 start_codon:yes stop_codon:yes gene_type:complete